MIDITNLFCTNIRDKISDIKNAGNVIPQKFMKNVFPVSIPIFNKLSVQT